MRSKILVVMVGLLVHSLAWGQYEPYPPAPPPPPVYYPPPQPVYVQPQPVYVQPVYVRPMAPVPPRPGIGTIITGFVFLALGAGMLGAGGWMLHDAGCGNDNGRGCFSSDASTGEAAGGATLAFFGGVFALTGIILVPVGFVQQDRYNRWIDSQRRRVGLIDKIEPVIKASANGGSLGLKLTF